MGIHLLARSVVCTDIPTGQEGADLDTLGIDFFGILRVTEGRWRSWVDSVEAVECLSGLGSKVWLSVRC